MDSQNFNQFPQTEKKRSVPLMVNTCQFIAGKYRNVPITIDEAIARSAGRAKVYPDGRRVFETTSFQERMKLEYGSEVMPTPKSKPTHLEKSQKKNIDLEYLELSKSKVNFNSRLKSCIKKFPKTEVKGKKLEFNK
jgi:hypothetical protein